MMRPFPSAIDDALDTLYEPNAVFSQFLGSASRTFFSLFLSLLPLLVLSFLAFLVFSLVPFLFRFRFLVYFLSFIFLIFSLFLFFQLTCVCRAYA